MKWEVCTLAYLRRRRNPLREWGATPSLSFYGSYCRVLAAGRGVISYNNVAKLASSETKGLLKVRFAVISV